MRLAVDWAMALGWGLRSRAVTNSTALQATKFPAAGSRSCASKTQCDVPASGRPDVH